MESRDLLLFRFSAWLATLPQTPRGLVADSREIKEGFLFAAMSGRHADGCAFIDAAKAKGAIGIIRERRDGENPDPKTSDFIVPDLAKHLGALADAIYQKPSNALSVIGVTGTNGKTSCTHWIARVLSRLNVKTAVIGTMGAGEIDHLTPLANTTPDAARLHQWLSRFHHEAARVVAMEVSSIGIEEHRVESVCFDTALLTNISRDHLDYHGTMEDYARAKEKLFAVSGLRAAVVNLDDAHGERFARVAKEHGAEVLTYSRKKEATLRASNIRNLAEGLAFEVETPQGNATIKTRVIGDFNVENLLGVLGVLLARGVSLMDAARAIETLTPPKGRLEILGTSRSPRVVVDYAHTPDALEVAARACRAGVKRGGQLIGVLGCGGDRDKGKRPMMGKIAGQVFDRIYVTNDNPRGEKAETIAKAIIAGIDSQARDRVVMELNRARAIHQAINAAEVGDTVLIAGKGHEDYQETDGARLPFSDQDEARLFLTEWDNASAMNWRLSDIAKAIAGELLGEDHIIARVVTDSRVVVADDLFVALKGETFDGHDFVSAILKNNAFAVVDKKYKDHYIGKPVIAVSDTGQALMDMANAWRKKFDIKLLVVTGSNGKTTVKEMIALCALRYYGKKAVLATSGNFNNAIGLPLTLLRLRPEHRVAVIELGMNHRGETAILSRVAEPNAVLINNAQREHQEFMKDIATVAAEHGDALLALKENGVAILNRRDAYFSYWQNLTQRQTENIVSFGGDENAQGVSGTWRDTAHGMALRVEYRHGAALEKAAVSIPVFGEAMAQNAQAALAAAVILGVPFAEAAEALASFTPVAGRLSIEKLDSLKTILIDDTYNANPESVKAAIDVLSADTESNSWLVLGDMGETGDQGLAFHQEIGHYAKEKKVARLFATGALSREAVKAFGGNAQHFENAEALSVALIQAIKNDLPSRVLVKGSRFMKMEQVVARVINADALMKGQISCCCG